MPEVELAQVGEAVDRLITVPMSNWAILKGIPVQRLYDVARARTGRPLTLAAAEILAGALTPGSRALLVTGFVIARHGRAETDGPVGAAVLARALSIGLGAVPVLVGEDCIRHTLAGTCAAAGLHVASYEDVVKVERRCAVLGFPIEQGEAERAAVDLLDLTQPGVVLAVERPGANPAGVYHSGAGFDISRITAKTDAIFVEARRRGIPTIGVGDLGNEVGMGYVHPAVRELVPHGMRCLCPCGEGIAAGFDPDLAVVATISNWGAYGIAACLAAALREVEVFHDGPTERACIEGCVRAGGIDPVSGLFRPYVDGSPPEVHVAIVELLRTIVQQRVASSIFTREYQATWEGRR